MKKVLVVENEKKGTIAMSVRLKAMGYDVRTAVDAQSAVAVACRRSPDIVMIDINFQDGEGFLVAELLQRLSLIRSIPFIFVTASKEPGLRQRATELGAVAFLEKPFDSSDIVDAIEGSYYAA